jgi:hypothetical protein
MIPSLAASLFLVLTPALVFAQNKCAAGKLKAAMKQVACKGKLEAREEKKGEAPDPAKIAKCDSRLVKKFERLEAKGGCRTTGDSGTFEAKVDAFLEDLVATSSVVVEGRKLIFLFVQTFEGGSLAPKVGEDGVYVLRLHGGHRRTIAFSDRPDRIVRSVPTRAFLDGLGFSPENPPNAALVLETAPGESDIIVVELLNPQYDEANMMLTYDVKVLDSFETDQGLDFREEPRVPHADGEEFGAAQLLIDDCPDLTGCYIILEGSRVGDIPPGGNRGQCWSWDTWDCAPEHSPCNGPTREQLSEMCNNEHFLCKPLNTGLCTVK